MEIVVATNGMSFSVTAARHELADNGNDTVTLRVPGSSSSTYRLVERTETTDEIVYVVSGPEIRGGVTGQPVGYPLTDMLNREQDRLVREIQAFEGPGFTGPWAKGESHREHGAWLRARLREHRASAEAG